MKINIKHILEGITNSIFVKEEVEKIAHERYEICNACPKMSTNIKIAIINKDDSKLDPGPYYSDKRPDEHCSMCACNIHAKVRSLHTSCPIEKWLPVASVEEAAKIAMITEENKT